tara:strand:- start:786 stop:1370 length:585 start_codon:yes stop_codon:yes gene_type:complete
MVRSLLTLIIFLCFNSFSSQADDISEFQIERISIGDSLLLFMDEKKISNKTDYFYKNKKFAQLICLSDGSIYDYVQCVYKPNDSKKKIYDVTGVIRFDNRFEECLIEKKKIEIEISSLFKNVKKMILENTHGADATGKSLSSGVQFFFNNGDSMMLYCTDWSEEMTKKNNWVDELKISLSLNEFQKFLYNDAYN